MAGIANFGKGKAPGKGKKGVNPFAKGKPGDKPAAGGKKGPVDPKTLASMKGSLKEMK